MVKSRVSKLSRKILPKIVHSTKKAGTLKTGRSGHGAIFDGKNFLIVGGEPSDFGRVKNEVCSLEGSTMTCVEQSSSLFRYAWYPELFLVAEDFGKC